MVGVPMLVSADGGDIDGLALEVGCESDLRKIAVGAAFEIAVHAAGPFAERGEIFQSVVAVTVLLGVDRKGEREAMGRRIDEGAAAKEVVATVDVVAGEDVLAVAVAIHVAAGEGVVELVVDDRPADRAAIILEGVAAAGGLDVGGEGVG